MNNRKSPEYFYRKPDGKLVFKVCKDSNDYAEKAAALSAAPTPPARGLPPAVLHALRFYANGEHFHIDPDAQEFDTVSGEPDNWLHSQRDDDCTMIEDGSVAKAVLQGKNIEADEDEPESAPIEGEVYSSAPPAPGKLDWLSAADINLHPATADLVQRFSKALAEKLWLAERKYGYSDGWLSKDWMDECRAKLIEHVDKGDPLDVAAYCAFLWHHREPTSTTPPAQDDGYITNCVVIPRETDGPLFPIKDGRRVCNIDSYAIIPLEQYEALKTPPAQEPDECPASGFDHTFRNGGPNGEKQCEYCGEPPAQKDEPVAYIDIRGNFWSIERAKAELEDGNLIDLRPVYTRLDNSELRKAVQQMARALQAGEWAEHVNDSDPALAALEREITRLVGEVNGLRKAGELVIESFKESEQMMWSGALINLRAALNKRKS